MAGITTAQAEAQLASWLAASTAAASGQSYSIGNRTLTRADTDHILQQVQFWQGMVVSLSRSGPTITGATPRG